MQSTNSNIMKGIDVYHGNNITDWGKVYDSGYQIAYMKATEGSTITDPKYIELAQGASAKGLKVGFYHYFWPYKDTDNAVKQAGYFYEAVRKFPYTCIPALDAEADNNMTKEIISEGIQKFIDEFERLSGHTVIIYANPSFINKYLMPQFSNNLLWIAHYGVSEPADTSVWDAWDAWQYTSKGSVEGITGNVDLDSFTDNILLKNDYKVYPGKSSFGPGKSNEYINVMGKQLIARGFSAHYTVGASSTWSEADQLNYTEWQYALGFKGSDADGIPGEKSWNILMSSEKITPAYPKADFFKLNTVSAFSLICGKALVKAKCSAYKVGPSTIWQKADQNSYKLFQKKIGDSTMDGTPGPQGWSLLQPYMDKC